MDDGLFFVFAVGVFVMFGITFHGVSGCVERGTEIAAVERCIKGGQAPSECSAAIMPSAPRSAAVRP